MDAHHDCLVVGGGAAGLSAALTLGRARRRTLVVDAGAQSNLAAAHIGGLLGNDRRPPAELYATARAELREYPTVEVREGEVATLAAGEDGLFNAELADGSWCSATRLLLATGMEYQLPDLPGLAQRWGEAAFHCPFCHGWEVRGRRLAVLASGAIGVHSALMLRAWSDDVTLLCGPDGVAAEDAARLREARVTIERREVAALHGPGRELETIELADGAELASGGLLVATQLRQRSALAAQLGVGVADPSPMAADAVPVDTMHMTDVPGVYAAGDLTPGPPSVTRAIASGNLAGAMVVAGLFA